jgi:sugar diacid utilization regulator
VHHDLRQPARHARAAIEALAEELVPELDEIAAAMTRRIHDEVAELPDALRPDAFQSCRAHVGLICALMRDGEPARSAEPPGEALYYAREAARQGVPLEGLMRKYRVGHAVFWRLFLERVQQAIPGHDELAAAITLASDWTFAYIDKMSGAISEAYMAERERWVRSAAAVRTEEVRRILDGNRVDEAESSQRLRYELRRRHLAFVIWGDEATDAGRQLGTFERLAHDLGRALGSSDVLCVPLGGLVLACWAGLRSDPDAAALQALIGSDAAARGARVALGDPHDGVAGFVRSHDEAMRSRHVAVLTRRSPSSPMRYADAALTSLLTGDVGAAQRFVERELGDLASDEDASRRVAATLKVFLEEGASFVKAARRLGVHENTVAYRVRRATEALGHGVDQRQLELRVALQLADVLRRTGAPALAADGAPA